MNHKIGTRVDMLFFVAFNQNMQQPHTQLLDFAHGMQLSIILASSRIGWC